MLEETKPIQGIFFRDFRNNYIPEILEEIYKRKVYDPYLEDKKDLTILDVGANVGLWTHFASPFAKKLYAVEPSEEHFECLVTMLASNNMENVVPVRKAISHENGTAQFFHNDNTTMYSLRSEVNTKADSETVETVTLDKFFEENDIDHVDLMKIDIEGSEAQVFGSEGFDKVKDKIDIIIGEFHTWSGVNPKQFESYFIDRGFSFEWPNVTDASLFVAKRQ